MRATNWSATTTADEAHRRAGGRRAYNARRRTLAIQRRARVALLLRQFAEAGVFRGAQARVARELGVSAATVSRDAAALLREWLASGGLSRLPS